MTKTGPVRKPVEFIPYLVVGDPSLEFSARMVDALIESGADLIELGVPYSDAIADGPVIQEASERTAKRVSLSQVLDFAAGLSAKYPGFRFVIFSYLNPVMKMGFEVFAARAAQAGVYAALIVDLPPEEAGEHEAALAKHGVKAVFLASPTTSPERLERIARHSTGFVYYVSRTGVTGTQAEVSRTLAQEMQRLRSVTDRPVAIGFGVSNAEQAAQIARLGDAVVVGSAFVALVSKEKDPERALAAVRSLAKKMSLAIRGAEADRKG